MIQGEDNVKFRFMDVEINASMFKTGKNSNASKKEMCRMILLNKRTIDRENIPGSAERQYN